MCFIVRGFSIGEVRTVQNGKLPALEEPERFLYQKWNGSGTRNGNGSGTRNKNSSRTRNENGSGTQGCIQ